MFERILIPLDGSPRAEAILTQVAKILRRKDSEIILLRVVSIPETSRFEPARRMAYDAVRGQERAQAHQYVQDLAKRLVDRGVRARGTIAEGPPAETILEQAKRERASLMAMSTHGRGGLSRWMMGSVAEKVARTSPIPVLMFRAFRPTPLGDLQPSRSEELPFRKLLVPTDGSPAALSVIDPVGKLAKLFDAEITLLHVEIPTPVAGYGDMGNAPVVAPTPSERDPATAVPAGRLGDLGLVVKRRTVQGYPAEAILDLAHSEEIDLVAMATHGRSGFSRWFLGSVTERVLRHAGVPLLLVRAEKTKEAVKGSRKEKGKLIKLL